MAIEFSGANLKMMQTASNEVFFPQDNDYAAWRNDMGKYTQTKSEFQGKAEPYVKVDYKSVKARETRYNPITQVYANQDREQHSRQLEKDSFLNKLA